MAVERKTFLWIGNDRFFRGVQDQNGITSGSYAYGATGVGSYLSPEVTNEGTYVVGGGDHSPGSTSHKLSMDVFWNDKENWAERTTGLSGGDGITDGANPTDFYYIKASRIPHRGDHVVFEFVRGSTGNGLLRGLMSSGWTYAVDGDSYHKPFDAPLSPCLFGGYSRPTDGLSAEGSIWVNADTAGSSAANRRGPLSSVKVMPSYFSQFYGVLDKSSKWYGMLGTISHADYRKQCLTHWGGQVREAGPSGASFGNVDWHVGLTGLNIKALDVQINSPYRMAKAMNGSPNPVHPFFPGQIQNPSHFGGELIRFYGSPQTSVRTEARLGYADNIINLSIGCHTFIGRGGNVHNFNINDFYMPNARDEEKLDVASREQAVENDGINEVGGYPEFRTSIVDNGYKPLVYAGTVSTQLRCDPCWYHHAVEFPTSIGSPDILWGPYYARGRFTPRVTAPGTVTCHPTGRSGKDITVADVVAGQTMSDDPQWDYGLGAPVMFGHFHLKGVAEQRYAVTTLEMKEFNPRWDVTTSIGNDLKTESHLGRGFNNQIYMEAGCTITNLNLDAGYFGISDFHAGGDTFDTDSEVGDIVILNGYAEQKSYLNGEHPTNTEFNAFYIGKGGVSETGNNFQIRSKDAEFDFGAGVYLRSGPDATGTTGAGFKFVQAPRFSTK